MNILVKKYNTKKIIPFLEFYDNIPINAKYLFSKEIIIDEIESDSDKNERIISGKNSKRNFSLYHHYYEVNECDFIELIKTGFASKNIDEKIKDFLKYINKYK